MPMNLKEKRRPARDKLASSASVDGHLAPPKPKGN